MGEKKVDFLYDNEIIKWRYVFFLLLTTTWKVCYKKLDIICHVFKTYLKPFLSIHVTISGSSNLRLALCGTLSSTIEIKTIWNLKK